MNRMKTLALGLLIITALPGCGCLCGDRPGLFSRFRAWRDRDNEPVYSPVSYPVSGGTVVGGDPNCGCTSGGTVIGPGSLPPGAVITPGGSMPPGATLQPPMGGGIPRIPPGKVGEETDRKGKVIEIDPAKGAKGPALSFPISGTATLPMPGETK